MDLDFLIILDWRINFRIKRTGGGFEAIPGPVFKKVLNPSSAFSAAEKRKLRFLIFYRADSIASRTSSSM